MGERGGFRRWHAVAIFITANVASPATAAHLADRVIPPVPVRQWVISVPKRRRSR